MIGRGRTTGLLIALALAALSAAPAAGAAPVELFTAAAKAAEEGGIAAGPDGNVWFTATESREIGRITPAGVITIFPLPSESGRPRRITAGPDGALWFLEGIGNGGRIGRIDIGGAVSTFALPSAGTYLGSIAGGGDGNVWFTEPTAGKVGRVTPGGGIAEFPVPTPGAAPSGIALGADGNVWVAEERANQVARVDPAGSIAEFALPPSEEGPRGIAAAPDGALWVSRYRPAALIRLGPDGIATTFRLPARLTYGPLRLAVDPLGNVWFSGEWNKLGRMTPSGEVTEYRVFQPPPCQGEAVPCDGGISPVDLTIGSDGHLWFLGSRPFSPGPPPAERGSVIGRIDPSSPPPAPAPTRSPSFKGRAELGDRLAAVPGGWTNSPTSYSYRWERCDARGERCRHLHGTDAHHLLDRDDLGHTLRVEVGAANKAGTTYRRSAPSRVIRRGAAHLRVRIVSRFARVRAGKVRLRLACAAGPRGSSCSGRMLLGGSRRRPAGLGSRRYRLATGRSAWIAVPVALRGGPRRARATATLWGGRPAVRTVRLVRARARG